jgi:hypothetical protein
MYVFVEAEDVHFAGEIEIGYGKRDRLVDWFLEQCHVFGNLWRCTEIEVPMQ